MNRLAATSMTLELHGKNAKIVFIDIRSPFVAVPSHVRTDIELPETPLPNFNKISRRILDCGNRLDKITVIDVVFLVG